MPKVYSSPMAIEWNRAPIWESAFKIAEGPMSYLNKSQNRYGNCLEFFDTFPTSFRDHGDRLLEGLKYRSLMIIKYSLVGFRSDVKESFIHLYEKKHLVAIFLATAIAFPTTVALAPISIIADIFAGTIQASLRLCQGADKDEILLILHKKVIASPVQQGIYLLTSVIALGILAGGMIIRMHQEGIRFIPAFAVSALVVSAIMGNVVYWNSQFVVASLPRFFIPDGYNVFIKGGAKDEFGIKVDFDPERKYLKWRHEWRHEFEETDKAYFDNIFANAIKETENELNKLSINFPQNFKTFRAWFSSDKKTYKLFGFSSADKVDENGLNKQFRALALQCHPDKFPDKEKKKEAEIWFKLLMAARFDVEENILKKRSAH